MNKKQLTHNQKIDFYLEGLNKGLANSLLLYGQAGCGKSTAIMNFMDRHGYSSGEQYKYLQNYTTPIQLFKKLKEVNGLKNPKILILDDIEDALKNTQIIGILKGACWGVGKNNERIVCWNSSSLKDEAKQFVFKGKVIIIVNAINTNNPLIQALVDRGFYYGITFTKQQTTDLILKNAKLPYQKINYQSRMMIANFLISQQYNIQNLSLRLLSKAYNLFLLSPSHWRQLLKECFVNQGKGSELL